MFQISGILILLLFMVFCSPLPLGFTTNNLYNRIDFNGSELNEKSVGLCPLLRGTGYDSAQFFGSDKYFENLKNTRPDLHFISVQETEKHILEKMPRDSLLFFYHKLFDSDIILLQTHDSFWCALKSDYYLVFRIVNSSSVKTFNKKVRKRLHAEAELWDCKDQEVVWRTNVRGICLSEDISDRFFIMEAVKKLLLQLPVLLPSNGNETW